MILRLLADENLDHAIVIAVRRLIENVDFVSVQDVNLRETPDPDILAWAAAERRIVVTHDAATMPNAAYQRIRAGLPTPGLIVVRKLTPVARAIEDIHLIIECESEADLENVVRFVPLT